MQNRLKKALKDLGRITEAYSTHSLWRGGATFAAAAGVPRNVIQEVGDWKSDAVDKYISNPIAVRVSAAQTLRDVLAVPCV